MTPGLVMAVRKVRAHLPGSPEGLSLRGHPSPSAGLPRLPTGPRRGLGGFNHVAAAQIKPFAPQPVYSSSFRDAASGSFFRK